MSIKYHCTHLSFNLYVDADQNGAFTAYSSIQGLNISTLLTTTKQSARDWSEDSEAFIIQFVT